MAKLSQFILLIKEKQMSQRVNEKTTEKAAWLHTYNSEYICLNKSLNTIFKLNKTIIRINILLYKTL